MMDEASVPEATSSPTRGRPRNRVPAKPRAKKGEARTPSETAAKVSKPRVRKAPEEGAPKASKRAKAMAAAAGEKIESKKATKGSKKYEALVQHALETMEANSTEVYADFVSDHDVERITSALTKAKSEDDDGEFEVENIPDGPSSPLPATSALVPWGPWALAPTDRSDGVNASLIETEEKLRNYYSVPFDVWRAVKPGRHTKYTTVKRFGAKSADEDFNDRKVVHAIVGDEVQGDKPGRMCSAWKSTMQPWKRTDHETLRFYVQKGDLPDGY